MTNRTCSIEGCYGTISGRGWCNKHYLRWQNHGSADYEPLTGISFFWSRTTKTESCWLWTGTKTSGGYGRILRGSKEMYAHRYSYEHFIGPIPDGLVIDHLCRVRHCVNPSHLEVVTLGENTRRGVGIGNGARFQKNKTHCPKGHPYDAENTYHYKSARSCKTCRRMAARSAYQRNKAFDILT